MSGPEILAWLSARSKAYTRAARTCKRDGDAAQAAVYKEVAAQLGDLATELGVRL